MWLSNGAEVIIAIRHREEDQRAKDRQRAVARLLATSAQAAHCSVPHSTINIHLTAEPEPASEG